MKVSPICFHCMKYQHITSLFTSSVNSFAAARVRKRYSSSDKQSQVESIEPEAHAPGGKRQDAGHSRTDQPNSAQASSSTETFEDYAAELERRRRKAEAKRRQDGSSFKDHIIITIRGGKGGSGAAAFSPTRSGSSGPPSGGNGGQGGSVYLTTSSQLTSLSTLRQRYVGGQGGNGSGDFRHGKRGDDIVLTVPIGSVVREVKREGEAEKIWAEEEGLALDKEERRIRRWERAFITHPGLGVDEAEYKDAETMLRRERRFSVVTPTFDEEPQIEHDLDEPINEPILIARGGQGGFGNPFFASASEYRASRIASRGVQPHTSTLELELKLLADVGLVGLPNAGKSTILCALTGRKAEVAGYEFTTLNPQVGVVRVWDDGTFGGGGLARLGEDGFRGSVIEESWQERERDQAVRESGEYIPVTQSTDQGHAKIEVMRFTISDNPGLLPQASENVGLGHSFLRSIERSLALAFILDLTRSDPASDLSILRGELEAYKPGLSRKGAVVVLNKGDEVDEEVGRERLERLRRAVEDLGLQMEVIVLSGKYGLGLQKLVTTLAQSVKREKEIKAAS